ncbi:hypothetical protein [Planotetraspora sp. GP83]|uniref:hypothetical protein n=1 Tax=Planotetraspora sp. GP83 TaxID=3156264 RepID=UPI003510F650
MTRLKALAARLVVMLVVVAMLPAMVTEARAEEGVRALGPRAPVPMAATGLRAPVRVPAGVTAGYVVDLGTGKVTARHQEHHRFRSASVVKILIALDYLERHKGPIPKKDLGLLVPMLRGSDDNAATALWRRGGQGRIVQRVARKLRLADTGPPPAAKPGFWGYTAISASDIALVYRYLLERADPRVRDFILGQLRKAWQCASDGFDQYFGIPRAVPRPWAVKQGWSGFGAVPPVKCVKARTTSSPLPMSPPLSSAVPYASSGGERAVDHPLAGSPSPVRGLASTGSATSPAAPDPVDFSRPVLHTTGVIGDRLIMVVLTLQPPGASFAGSAKRVTKLARDVYLSVV